MKTSARFLAMLLAVVMIASAALSVSAFSDVTGATEHATAISVLSQLGVIGGYEDGTFKPEKEVTRAEMAKLVYVLYTTFQDAGKGTAKFDDVAADNWAAGYISWCFNKGIIGGFGNGTFKPTANVTYDQALKMVCGTLGYNEWDSALWPVDVRTKALRDLKLGEDIPADVKGDQALTRGQVAQLLYNALSAEMAEKKMEKVTLPGSTTEFFAEKPMVLKTDMWKFEEVVNVATQVAATSDPDEKSIVLTPVGGSAKTYKLAELGLEAYEGKTDVLDGLHVITVKRDGKMLASATVKGSVIDNVALTYTADGKTLKINGVEYTAEDFDPKDATDPKDFQVAMAGGNAVQVFADDAYLAGNTADPKDKKDCLTKAFINIAKKAKVVRIIDIEGDGNINTFEIAEKAAYKAVDVKPEGTNKVLTLSYVAADATANTVATKQVVADIVGEVKKDDIFVAAKIGDTFYVEVVAPVETYATKLGTETITLKEGGAVKYANVSVNNVTNTFTSANVMGADKKANYYIYNGEVIYSEASSVVNEYNFAILKEIVKVKGEVDPSTMIAGDTYKAILVVDGKDEEIVLDNSKENNVGKHEVNGLMKTAAELYPIYTTDVTVRPGAVETDGTVAYNYALVAAYKENNGSYVLTIGEKDLDTAPDDNYTVIPAGATLYYDASNNIYKVTYNGTTTSMIDMNDSSVIYYTVTKTATGAHKHLASYNVNTITKKTFKDTITTTAPLFLLNNEDGTKTILATFVDKEILGATGQGVKTYKNDGRLVIYAPVASEEALNEEDGKLYNSYVFMDLEKLANKDAVLDTLESKNANATVAGLFYGYDESDEKYYTIAASTVAGQNMTSVVEFTIDTVVPSKNLINIGNDTYVKVNENTVIWGLAEKDKLDVYKTFTLEDLQAMDEAIDTANGTAIRGLAFQYVDDANATITTAIVVDTYDYDAENNDTPYLVNGSLIDNFKAN